VADRQCKAANDQGWGRGRRPVINVSYEQAVAFTEWLSDKTSKRYRLLTEAEWEYAARAGSERPRFWGSSTERACTFANVANPSTKQKYDKENKWEVFECDDGYVETAPVGSFKPNTLGLHDMLGNVWEWVKDCWNTTYEGAPADGSVWSTGDCRLRVVRGGCWSNGPRIVRSAARSWLEPAVRLFILGFRLARTLP
jgi:sulfatase modifying factor 1